MDRPQLTIVTHAMQNGEDNPALPAIYDLLANSKRSHVIEFYDRANRLFPSAMQRYIDFLNDLTANGSEVSIANSERSMLDRQDIGGYASFRLAGGYTNRCLSSTLESIVTLFQPDGGAEVQINPDTAFYPIANPDAFKPGLRPLHDTTVSPEEFPVSLSAKLQEDSSEKAIRMYFFRFVDSIEKDSLGATFELPGKEAYRISPGSPPLARITISREGGQNG